jgi:hypothetical protein
VREKWLEQEHQLLQRQQPQLDKHRSINQHPDPSQQLPFDLGHLYIVLLPPNVSSDSTIPTDVCAYHTWASGNSGTGNLVYAVIPYPTTSCYGSMAAVQDQAFTTPTQAAIDFVSHEHMEALTDPTGTAWYAGSNPNGGEIGDLCAGTFGPGSTTTYQTIGPQGNKYLLQWEYSNDDAGNATNGCIGSEDTPTASFTQSASSVSTGQPVSFDASASTDPDPDHPALSYSWDFGDGSPVDTTSGAKPSHTYAGTGNAKTAVYTATLTVTDTGGWTSTKPGSIE